MGKKFNNDASGRNPKALLMVMKDEGVDAALSCAKALGYTKFEAWRIMEKELFKKEWKRIEKQSRDPK